MSVTHRAILGFATVGLLGALGASCGNSSATLEGQLDTAQFRLVDAQVVAIDAAGSTRRASVSNDGSFSLELPVPGTYNIRFANGTQQAGIYDAFAVLTEQNAKGQLAQRFTLKSGGTIALGVVRRSTGSTSLGLRAADDDDGDSSGDDDGDSSGDDDGDSSGDDDGDSDSSGGGVHEDDVDLVCDLGGGSDYSNVEAEGDMSGYVDSDGDGTVDDEDDGSACDDEDSDSDDADSDSDGTSTSTSTDDDADSDDADSDDDSDSDGHHACSDDGLEDSLDEPCGSGAPPGEANPTGSGETADPTGDPDGQVVPGNL